MIKGLKNKNLVIACATVVSFALSFIIDLCFFNQFVFSEVSDRVDLCRIFLFTLILMFIFLNFILDRKEFYAFLWNKRFLIAGIIFICSVFLEVSGSSMLVENNMIQPSIDVANSETILGKNRPIRSDEWNTGVPSILAQTNSSGFEYFNKNLRATETDVFATAGNIPIIDVVAVSKPFTWGFSFLDAAHGYSFWWMGRLICLFMATLELGVILTKNNRKLSVMLAFLITFAPATSWWFSSAWVDLLIFGQLSVVILYHYFDKNSKIRKIFFTLALSISMLSFAVVLYPAWEIPLAYIFGALGLIIIIKQYSQKNISWFDILMLLLLLFNIVFVLARFFILSKSTIDIMSNTVYPGARFSIGGEGLNMLLGYSDGLFYPYFDVANPCEPSVLMCLFPIPIFYSIIAIAKSRREQRKISPYLLVIAILSIFFTLFVICGFPNWLSKITFLYTVPGNRMSVIVSLLCVYLIAILVAEKQPTKLTRKTMRISIVISLLYAILLVIWTYCLTKNMLGNKLPFVLITFLFLFVFSFIYMISDSKRVNLLLVFAIIISTLSGATVNPIISGMNVFSDKPIAQEIRKINREDPGKWLVVGSIVLSNYVVAQGVPTINSINSYPNFDILAKLDEDQQYNDIYNRYAHIGIVLEENSDTYFKLNQPDYYTIHLSIKDLDSIGVKYIVSIGQINDYDAVDLHEIYNEDNFYIYNLTK